MIDEVLLQEMLDRYEKPVDRIRLQVLHVAPDKPRDGELFFADGTNWNPGSGGGTYEYRSGLYTKL